MTQRSTGIFITLAWPDCFARSYGGYLDKAMGFIGAGTQSRFKVGHAALVLIEKQTGIIEYFDFGRYMTPEFKARVRGQNTDPDVAISLKAQFDKTGKLSNLEDILIFLESIPEVTHGEGRMLASASDEIDYAKAKEHILAVQSRGSVRYGPFTLRGTNCSRFVRDAFLAGTYNRRLWLRNRFPILGTPLTVGNVVNSTPSGEMWIVEQGKVLPYPGGRRKTILELFQSNFGLDGELTEINLVGNMLEPERPKEVPAQANWLSGVGAGAWFHIEKTSKPDEFRGQRYDACGTIRYSHIFRLQSGQFDAQRPYELVHDCHAERKTVLQDGLIVVLLA